MSGTSRTSGSRCGKTSSPSRSAGSPNPTSATRPPFSGLAAGGAEQIAERADAIDATVRDLLQVVVIDLGADENAQEIFETLNARGAQLTASDLIKNFIFQRLLESKAAVETAYEMHWRDF